MSTSILETTETQPAISPELVELARRTGLILRPLTTEIIDQLYDELERDDPEERAETLAYFKQALNQSRAAVGAEPMFPNE
jgi:hypothetical protein